MRSRLLLALVAVLACAVPASARTTFRLPGGVRLAEAPSVPLAFHTPAGWATSDAQGRHIEVRIEPAGQGAWFMRAKVTGGDTSDVDAMRIGFTSPSSERFFGFGERSNVLNERGRDVENYVSDGPWPAEDYGVATATVPPQGFRPRDDATYYPVPWLLSSRGYGVLIDRDETSTFHLATDPRNAWSAEVQSRAIALRIFGGPTLAQVLRRFTAATGRQPAPAAPWQFGPWFQTGQPNTVPLADEAAFLSALQKADAPVSAAETQLRYLPCGLDRGNEAYEAQRVKFFHDHGLAVLTYTNPMLCQSYEPLWDQAVAAGALQKTMEGGIATFDSFVGGTGDAGFTIQPVAQFDFTSDTALDVYGGVLKRILAAGHDGWMEDFGEYTPADATDAIGDAPQVMHNGYPTVYHCGVAELMLGKHVVRFQRSGWTGAARCAQDVWGGDPVTAFGFDGLASAVKQALSIGMSGVSRWGSDIGGYDTLPGDPQLTPELLKRWIEFGAVSGVMRTKASGIAVPPYTRPQVFDPAIVRTWRRYAKLHTQLYPYLRAADAEYRDTGLPLMRALALTEPGAPATDDEFGFGPDLFAAPVIRQGETSRAVRLPRGRWLTGLAYRPSDGAWVAHRAAAKHGTVRVHAGTDDLPLFVRAGALLPLLPANVDSLYHRRSFPTLRLLAFPRGRSKARIFDSDGVRSRLTAREWTLTFSQSAKRRVEIEAVLPWHACGARTTNGVAHRTVRIGSGTVRIQRCS